MGFVWVAVLRLGDEASSVFIMRNSKISLAGIGGVAQQDRASGPERKRSPGKPDEKGLLAIFTYKKPPALTANILRALLGATCFTQNLARQLNIQCAPKKR